MAQSARRFKNRTYEQLALVGKALASPIRLEMIDVLSQGPRTVEDLSVEIGQSIANTSQHLQVLRSARLIEAERRGTYVTYRIADQQVLALASLLHRVGESRLAEIQQITQEFLESHGALERVDCSTLIKRIRRAEVTLLDVRPREEYEAGHIPKAISVPLEDLRRHMAKLPKGREIVAYCRGPLCVMSIEAVKILRKKGFHASRWEESIADWAARGLPVEMSKPA
jgi:rhodanese-related sulfurtransferase/DNA-binding transcriptional ArsR family regulator